ncbi:MAG: hypothetical protein HQL94_08330 [Magnetococcales bacterium]|nr:hypothetical protein [Magnetococcales bacterium]MBF0440232.1 hypothetical protein [Magnetococcales bacterium]
MDLISSAGFLIQRAVQTATQLHQQSREKEGRTNVAPIRDKQNGDLGETPMMPVRSSAYRVTLSAAAQKQLSVSGMA